MIPLHCLVFADLEQLTIFPAHERLSLDRIAYDLVGEYRCGLHAIAMIELRHRASLKLSLGQRVAVAKDGLTAPDIDQLTTIASGQGAEVVDLKLNTDTNPVPILPTNPYGYVRSRWKGITVVGDLHGDLNAFHAAVAWAQSRHHFLWLLGDVIDYGPQTLQTAEAVYREVMAGNAAMVLGNHERKIARWLDQHDRHCRISNGNRITVEAIEALDAGTRRQWIGRFRSLLAHAALLQQIDNVTLLHAAAHPSLWTNRPNAASIEQYALYGEADRTNNNYRRVHRWVDAVPAGQMVFVGHDKICDFPIIVDGAKGGQIVFLDTGCGTGGSLSTADLRFNPEGLRLECFNRH